MHDKKLVIVSGKGGVGKSAVSAAIAHDAAARGRKTLVLSMTDSGMGLGAHLGSPHLEFAPTRMADDLWALAMNRSRALVEFLQIQLRLPSYATFTPAVRAFDVLASTAPAVREIVVMGKVLWEVRTGRWDLVVADGPPTGQLGSFLYAATAIGEWASTGRLAEHGTWMRSILEDETSTSLVLVTVPEELPTTETLETVDWLDKERVVGPPTIVANRVLTPLRAEIGGRGARGDAATLHRSLQEEQEGWLDILPPDIRLPFLFGADDPTSVTRSMSDALRLALT